MKGMLQRSMLQGPPAQILAIYTVMEDLASVTNHYKTFQFTFYKETAGSRYNLVKNLTGRTILQIQPPEKDKPIRPVVPRGNKEQLRYFPRPARTQDISEATLAMEYIVTSYLALLKE